MAASPLVLGLVLKLDGVLEVNQQTPAEELPPPNLPARRPGMKAWLETAGPQVLELPPVARLKQKHPS